MNQKLNLSARILKPLSDTAPVHTAYPVGMHRAVHRGGGGVERSEGILIPNAGTSGRRGWGCCHQLSLAWVEVSWTHSVAPSFRASGASLRIGSFMSPSPQAGTCADRQKESKEVLPPWESLSPPLKEGRWSLYELWVGCTPAGLAWAFSEFSGVCSTLSWARRQEWTQTCFLWTALSKNGRKGLIFSSDFFF